MPRLRFTMRWLMIAVAIAGVSMGLWIWSQKLARLRDVYLRRVSVYVSRIQKKRERIALLEKFKAEDGDAEDAARTWDKELKIDCAILKRLTTLRDKYSHAASHPWEHVEEDPPYIYKVVRNGDEVVPPHPWENVRDDDPDDNF